MEKQLEPSERTLSIAFLRPAIVHLLAHGADQSFLESVVTPLKLKEKAIVFIPVNDNEDERAGGAHWSLLVYFRPANSFYYYDSLSGCNIGVAKRTKAPSSYFVEVDTPKQMIGYDCGIYVISITEMLTSRILESPPDLATKPGDLSMWRITRSLSSDVVATKRKDLQNLILTLAASQQNS
ncbi:SUMO1 sentrin specific peptidase 8 [Blyttiomyces sp. JEL0837]|nr:SUMO1 sentrin specific peptidase 8 [Blyttiomyces sp. JEL0837]